MGHSHVLERITEKFEELVDAFDETMRAGPIRRRLRSLFVGMARHHAGRAASAMAFELFLATIPMLAIAGWLIAQTVTDSRSALSTTSVLLDLTPAQVHRLVDGQLGRFSGSKAVAPIALIGSWWLAAGAFHRTMTVFELALHAQPRPWWRKRAIGLVCVLVLVVALAGSGFLLVVLAGGPATLLGWLFGAEAEGASSRFLALPIALAVAIGMVAAFFRIAVRRPGIRRRVWPGAVVSVLLGAGTSWLFATYAKSLASYTVFYGSLAAVAIVLAWLWLCCAALLIGAELNAQLEGLERATVPPDVHTFPPAPERPRRPSRRRAKADAQAVTPDPEPEVSPSQNRA